MLLTALRIVTNSYQSRDFIPQVKSSMKQILPVWRGKWLEMGYMLSSKPKVAMKHLRDRKYTLEKSLLITAITSRNAATNYPTN